MTGGDPTFEQVLEAQDRSRKLLEKSGGAAASDIDPTLLEVDAERELHRVLSVTAEPLAVAVRERRFGDAVALAAGLGPVVEAFFSKEAGVMVMAEEEAVRDNRLLLLSAVIDATAPHGDGVGEIPPLLPDPDNEGVAALVQRLHRPSGQPP